MYKFLAFLVISLIHFHTYSQFSPAAGLKNSNAIHADSSSVKAWASDCFVSRSWVNIADTTFQYNNSTKASYGTSENGIGKSDNQVVSLGDGGFAIVTFSEPIANGNGYDFAVFENSFSENFLELAFVEVSSDGKRFVRFPSISATQTDQQIGGFDNVSEASKIHNLAGKYKVFYGTPFDLDDLKDSANIDLSQITHIKIVDVIGLISDKYARLDSKGNKINEPFPTPFHTCGFDLDAVAVLNHIKLAVEETESVTFSIFPNPASNYLIISTKESYEFNLSFLNLEGKLLFEKRNCSNSENLALDFLSKGIYLLKIESNNIIKYTKIFIQ